MGKVEDRSGQGERDAEAEKYKHRWPNLTILHWDSGSFQWQYSKKASM